MTDRLISNARPVAPIAIIGIACRFPGGACNPAAFWQLLADGRDAIQPIARDGLELSRFYDPRPRTPGRMMTQWGGFLDDLELFDAEFFGISPREAASVDPAQRLLLETVWEAFEDATIDPLALRNEPVGVYVGQWLSDFESRLFADTDQVDLYSTTGSGRYAASGRLSYFLGRHRPIDHDRYGLLIVAGRGSSRLPKPSSSRVVARDRCWRQRHPAAAHHHRLLAERDDGCRTATASSAMPAATATCAARASAVVLLKPLARALADGDPIRAVIRGSAVNNDGRGSGHLATPSRSRPGGDAPRRVRERSGRT